MLETGLLDELKDALIASLLEWVKIVSQGAREERGLLRDHRDLLTKVLQGDLCDVVAIDLDVALFELDDSGQGHGQGGLAGASAAAHSNLVAGFDLEVEASEHDVSVGAVSELDVVEGDGALCWPALALGLDWLGALLVLLGDVVEVEDALGSREDASHVIEAVEEVLEPAKVLRPVEQEDECHSIGSGAFLGDQDQSKD